MCLIKLALIVCLCSSAVVVNYVSGYTIKGCTIQVPKDIPKFEPIMLLEDDGDSDDDGAAAADHESSYVLFKPNGSHPHLPLGARLKLSCAGHNNVIETLDVSTLDLRCTEQQTFRSVKNPKEKHKLASLGCKSIPRSTLRATSEVCAAGKARIYEAGFMLAGLNFQPTFSICFNAEERATYYTHNVINGAAIRFNVPESTRRKFTAEGLNAGNAHIDEIYKRQNQERVFKRLFGANLASKYINKKMFLSRGHLTPDADFIFGYEQLSTYLFANVAPQYQSINAGNWWLVEHLARALASSVEHDLHIYNGYFDELQLPDKHGANVTIDLGAGIVAPAYYFKVIKDEIENAAIVFVTSMNPFMEEPPEPLLCRNVCAAANMEDSRFSTAMTHGFTYCCELDEFKQIYEYLPEDLTAAKLLIKS